MKLRRKVTMIDRPAEQMTVQQYHDWYWGSGAVLVDRAGIEVLPVVPGDTVEINCWGTGKREMVIITIIEDPDAAPVEVVEREKVAT